MESYAGATRPKKEQAVIIDAVDGLSNDDYIDGLETLIAVSNIVSISRISRGRICVFLTSKSLAEKLSGSSIRVNNNVLHIKPLIEGNKRLVLSNVQTHIPNEVLVEALTSHGILLASPIQNIRASLSKPGRSHIQSHRRQVYIKESNTVLPESFKILHEGINYWIYLTTDSTQCFTCKQVGHIAKLCPQNKSTYTQLSPSQNNVISESHNTAPQEQTNQPSNVMPVNTSTTSDMPAVTVPAFDSCLLKAHASPIKRQMSSSLTISSSPSSQADEIASFTEPKAKNPTPKKMKKTPTKVASLTDIRTQMEPLEKCINEKSDAYPLTYDKVTEFLYSTYNKSNILEISLDFTEETPALINMLSDIHDLSTNNNLQNRIKRLIVRLNDSLESSASDEEGVSSITDSDFQHLQNKNDKQEPN